VVTRPALSCVMLAAGLILLGGCHREPPQQLLVRGGPSVDGLFSELITAYQAAHPEVRVVSNFTCPPCRVMATRGMPVDFDIFVSLGDFELQTLRAHSQFVPAETRPIGTTRLVIATSVHAASPVRTVADLHKAKFRRMGIGNPETVGVGYYAEQALRKMGLWQELRPRLVYSQSGCELLKWLGLGRDIDAAVVFSLCVSDEPGSVRQVMEFPLEAAPPVPVLLSVAQQAPHQAETVRFIDFARQAGGILRKYRVEPVGG